MDQTTPTYTPNNLPFGWEWHSIDGANVHFFAKGNDKKVGEVKLVSADGKAWHVKAHLHYKHVPFAQGTARMMLLGNRKVDTLGNFESKQEAIAALIARHVQHKLEGNP